MSFASMTPILSPLIGALLLLVMPQRWQDRPLARHVYLGALVGALVALVVLALGDVSVGVLMLNSPYPMSMRAFRWVWDGLALQFALLPVLGLALQAITQTKDQRPFAQRVVMLTAVGACVAGCAAADLLTLCVCWGLMDLALMVSDLWQVDASRVVLGQQRIWARALAILCLTVAATLLAFDQGRTEWAYAALDSKVQSLIMVVAWLRLTGFPLPGGSGTRQSDRLIALSTGGLVWLRLGSVASLPPGQPWLIAVAAAGLGILGLISLLAQDDDRRFEALFMQGVTMLLLAPLVDPLAGFGVAGLLAVTLGVVQLIQIGGRLRIPAISLGRWQAVPQLMALASLAGLPLTLGGVAHWDFLRLVYLAGQRGVLVVTSGSLVLVAMACWRSGHRLWATFPQQGPGADDGKPSWRSWLNLGWAGLLAVYLVFTGIQPAAVERLWRNGFAGIDLPGFRTAFTGPVGMLGTLLVADLLLPVVGVWATAHVARVNILLYRGPLRDVLERLLRLDWFYLGLAQGLDVLQAVLRRVARVLEESFALGWSIFWAIVFALYTMRV